MAAISLKNTADTNFVGQWLAINLAGNGLPPVFLYGELGSGKTTLIGSVVRNLIGWENTEFSSPSFTVYNIYPTEPPVLHCDLYRCQNSIPEDILDLMDESMQTFVEWANFFPRRYLPKDYLDITLKLDKNNNSRLLTIAGTGAKSTNMVNTFWRAWSAKENS